MRLYLTRLIFVLSFSLSLTVGWTSEAAAQLPAEPKPDWDTMFTRNDGWTGGDGAGTVLLPDGRVLWIFGDTWIGQVKEGAHVPGAAMVNITTALHKVDIANPLPANESDVEFGWNRNGENGKPASWLVPDPQVFPEAGSWFWPTGGGFVDQPTDGDGPLVVFLWNVARTKKDQGIWSFRTAGNGFVSINNWRKPFSEWELKQFQIPHARVASEGEKKLEMTWGQAALAYVDETGNKWHLVYGLRTQPGDFAKLIVARVPSGKVTDFAAWEFLGENEVWVKDPEKAVSRCDGMVSEFSIESMKIDGKSKYVLVHSELFLGKHVLIRTADSPFGPWTKPVKIFEVPELKKNKTYFTYAAKGHAMLSRPDHLLITYVVNAQDFGAMFRDAEIYRPRFIEVDLRKIVGE